MTFTALFGKIQVLKLAGFEVKKTLVMLDMTKMINYIKYH